MKGVVPMPFSISLGVLSAILSGQASANLIIYTSESDFLNTAPVISTETFDQFPSPTVFSSPQVVIDQVFYGVVGPCPEGDQGGCWIVGINLFPGFVTPPNDFGASSIAEHRISFGAGNYVHAYGFWFLSGVLAQWEVIVHEIDGTNRIELLQSSDPPEPHYLGFLSDVGIRGLTVRPSRPAELVAGNWSYDNVSRSQILPMTQQSVNDFVTLRPIHSTFTFSPNTAGCPAGFGGEFIFDARLVNVSDQPLRSLAIAVNTLTDGNLLQNADGGVEGVDARLTVPEADGFIDGLLGPHEFVDVPFIVCLRQRRPFTFVVDALGVLEAQGPPR